MGQVGDPPQPLRDLGLEPAEPLFLVGDRRLEPLALVDQGRSLFGISLAACGLGHLVLAAADFFDIGSSPLRSSRGDNAVDVLEHVVRDVPVPAVL